MKRIAIFLLGITISIMVIASASVSSQNIIGKWELIRVEYPDAKSKPPGLPSKPKMGGAEFFANKTVLFSDGLSGEWSILADGRIKITLMEVLEMFGSIQGDLLKLSTELNPNEIMVLRKAK